MAKSPWTKREILRQNAAILMRVQPSESRFLDPKLGQKLLLEGAYDGNIELVTRLLDHGVSPAAIDVRTGMNALHLAVGRNHFELTRLLVRRGTPFVPDKRGRMPTTIAAQCEVSEELCDFIAEAEAWTEGV